MELELPVIARCKHGAFHGAQGNKVFSFRGIRYADDCGRFKPCKLTEPVDDGQEATSALKPSAVFPQILPEKSLLGVAEEERNQSEDAFFLNVYTPGPWNKVPVVFWIHGGGWNTGSSQAPQYDGRELARTGKCVFVAMNYRLGCLGNFPAEGDLGGNLAMRDILTAFEWVRENISSFGGDPDKIVVCGQSAGAAYAVQMLGMPSLAGKIYAGGIFSFPGDAQFMSLEVAKSQQKRVFEKLGVSSVKEMADMDVNRILEVCQPAIGVPEPPMMFMPYWEDGFLDWDVIEGAASVSGANVPLFIGTNADEAAMFMDPSEFKKDGYWDKVAKISRMFFKGCDAITEAFKKAGGTCYRYSFDHPCAIPHLGACHCTELPYFFGNIEKWEGAPVIKGISEKEFDELTERYQGSFLSFCNGEAPWDPEKTELID